MPSAHGKFGSAVKISDDGNILFVGNVNFEDNANLHNHGEVKIYSRSSNDDLWQLKQTLTAMDAHLGDQFGHSLALSADGLSLLVGAPGHRGMLEEKTGAAYLFKYNNNVWSQHDKLVSHLNQYANSFGIDVAINTDGTRLAIADVEDDSNFLGIGNSNESMASEGLLRGSGAVYIFSQDLVQSEEGDVYDFVRDDYIKNTISSGTYSYFGNSIDLNSDSSLLIVGQHRRDISGLTDSGAAFLYTKADGVWVVTQSFNVPDALDTYQSYGHKVLFSDDNQTLFISAPGVDSDGINKRGAVYS